MIKWIKNILGVSTHDKPLNTEDFGASLIPEAEIETPKPKKIKKSNVAEKTAPKKRGRPKKNADSV